MRIASLGLCVALLVGAALAPPIASANGPDHALYAELLERHTRAVSDVAGTRVDYKSLGADPQWRQLVSQLEAAQPSELKTRNEKLAFWVNAYNILAIQTVLRGYPLDSIRDLGSFISPVWKKEAGRIGGEVVTLHQIEHEILRPMNDSRIHAAIVCASTSCPSLARKPFTAEKISAELSAAMRGFLADTGKGLRIDRRAEKVTLSSIFDWFAADFRLQGGVVKAIIPYAPPRDRPWLTRMAADVEVEYFDYDWRLNDTTPPGQRR